ncbi:MAG: carboxypeptidase regulatory-like domain-containing protein [Bacteroidales bacterium]|jgi:hypothetical protein|nr:carboxypeptidase regulatory-like domain-containing protein [Bacteroidales bacterium]
MRINALLFPFLIFGMTMVYGQHDVPTLPEYYVDVTVKDHTEIQKLSIDYSIDRILPSEDNEGFQVRLWIPNQLFPKFDSLQLPYSIVLENNKFVEITDSYFHLLTYWDSYPTYSAYLQTLSYFAEAHGDICSIDTILKNTLRGRMIPVLRIHNNNGERKPSVFLSSAIHGDEVTGYYLMLRLANFILSQRDNPKVQQIIEHIDLWICPLENPDGTYYSGDHTLGASPISTRGNAHQVDLNRNFPKIFGMEGETYEPETEAFMEFFEKHRFTLSAAIHGGAELVNYPWDSYKSFLMEHPDRDWWVMVGTRFVTNCQNIYPQHMSTVPSGVVAGGDWYVVFGSRQDYVTHYQYGREFTIEISESKVLPSESMHTLWGITKEAFLDFILEGDRGITGQVYDSVSLQMVNATIFIENHDESLQNSFVLTNDAGQYFRLIAPGTYEVTCTASPYKPMTKTVTVAENETTILDFDLAPLSVTEYKNSICQVYPTFADQTVTVELTVLPATCQLFTIDGTLISTHPLHDTKTTLHIADLAAGTYLAVIKNEQFRKVFKIVNR